MRLKAMTLGALAVLTTLGCAHKKAHVGEPLDPTGEDKVSARQKSQDQFNKLLAATVLHFGFDDSMLTTSDQRRLQTVADEMRVRPWAAIRIAGHTDERGTEEYNLALGQRRADSARAYLLALGIDEGSVETISFGEESPVSNEADEDGWAENRRAEFGAQPLELFGLNSGGDDGAP